MNVMQESKGDDLSRAMMMSAISAAGLVSRATHNTPTDYPPRQAKEGRRRAKQKRGREHEEKERFTLHEAQLQLELHCPPEQH